MTQVGKDNMYSSDDRQRHWTHRNGFQKGLLGSRHDVA